ncbi:MAG: heat-inducible transcription repressor HrcA [Candidatus Omnitrophica bacterium]|nr:heat-inducible transcription repressor HrcA [Candidatus Omnitrophota bacterium]
MMSRSNYLKKEARNFLILGYIVNSYVSNGKPVSSGFVSRKMGGSISSATVRNIMGQLEEKGYLEQPHTSAGRIPTNEGYRLYVDMVRDRIELGKYEVKRLSDAYTRRLRTIEEVIETTSRILSRELHHAGIVMWPGIEDYYLKHIELVDLGGRSVLAVLVTMTNAVKNYIARLDRETGKKELDRTANYINRNFAGKSVSGISDTLRKTVDSGELEGEDHQTAVSALALIDSVIEEDIGNEIYWEGLNYFMDDRKKYDRGLARSILQIYSHKRELVNTLKKELLEKGILVHIGEDSGLNVLRECSMVTCGYELHGRIAGRIGVIGPTRMDYENALRTISCLSRLVSHKLEEINI